MFRATNILGRRALTTFQSKYASRNLFTANALGITRLDQMRAQKAQLFSAESRQRYLERLTNYLDSNELKSIYHEDLVNIIGIANSDGDLDLIERLLENSTQEQRTFLSGWTAVIMRLYYKMDRIDRAMSSVKDLKRFGELFNMHTCYKIAMTMLYDRQQYEEVLDLYRLSQERLKLTSTAKAFAERTGEDMAPHPDSILLALSALAKINTPNALEEAKTLLASYKEKKKNIGLRKASLVAYLATMNGDTNYALNLISSIPSRNYVSLRDIKILALLQAGRYDDVLWQMRDYAASSKLTQHQLLKTTFEELEKAKHKIQDAPIKQELEDILVEIKDGNHVSEETLDGIIFRPVDYDVVQDRFQNDADGTRRVWRGSRDFESDRRPLRYDRYADSRAQVNEEVSNRTRRDGRGRRNDRRFSFQNVNFEA